MMTFHPPLYFRFAKSWLPASAKSEKRDTPSLNHFPDSRWLEIENFGDLIEI